MRADDDSRQQGIDLADLPERLESVDFLVDNRTLLDRYGDHELDLPDGTQSLSTVLGVQPDDTTYESADGVRQAVKSMVDRDAVGREDYSDRGVGGEGGTEDERTEESV